MENTAGAEGATIEEASVPQELFQEPPRLSEGATTEEAPVPQALFQLPPGYSEGATTG